MNQSDLEKIAALEKEVAYWKTNHADMVKRCEFLSQRPDLPVDRIPAYKDYENVVNLYREVWKEFVNLQDEIKNLQNYSNNLMQR